jgi:phasin family protein
MVSQSIQFAAVNKELFESQLATFHELTDISLLGTEMIIALSMAATKFSVERSVTAIMELQASEDPRASLDLATSCAKQNAETVTSYHCHLADVMASINREFTKVAEAKTNEARSKVGDFVGHFALSAPTGNQGASATLGPG